MKKLNLVFCITMIIIIPTYVYSSSCDDRPQCVKPTETEYYYIKLILDGEEFDPEVLIFNFGRPDVDSENPSVALSSSGDSMQIFGIQCGQNTVDPNVKQEVYGWLSVQTPGVYLGEYGESLSPVGSVNLYFPITIEGVTYAYSATAGTFTITTFGDVGSDVLGVFSLTFESFNSPNPAPYYDSPLTATGEFCLLRVPDALYMDE